MCRVLRVSRSGYYAWRSRETSQRANEDQKPSSKAEARYRRWLRGKRDLIETVGGVLADQFKIETTRARSLWGVATRVIAKLLAFNLSIFINQLLHRPPLAIKELYL